MANKQASLGDRFAEITVILVTVIALAAGWFYKSSIENASLPFSAEGISAEAPKGWLQAEPSGDVLLRTTDINSSGFGATYTVRKIAIAGDATSSEIASRVSLEHAQNLIAFRMLDQREVTVHGRDAFEINYVFVESNPDLTHTEIPSVVLGTDYVFLSGDHAIVVSFQADEKNYDLDLNRFHLFLQSLNF
ncbi:MAG TPA: hypothetical protein PK152_09760 [Anaerolineales bacterium]|jgi:hypothetical protein|nr:hypothetical protein [Anaerolineae bacterium]HRJ55619.1 hypothetical protein [Anaerolineales bacterium]HRK89407.1 hypothetical protein [Anaerolineales bacterium]